MLKSVFIVGLNTFYALLSETSV